MVRKDGNPNVLHGVNSSN